MSFPVPLTLTRRGLLASVVLGTLAGAVGCTAESVPGPLPDAVPTAPRPADELLGHAEAARRDAATAAALAVVLPERAPVLQAVSGDRTAHADALDAELARAAGSVASTPATAAPTTTRTAGAPDLATLQGSLRQAQDAAAQAATTAPAHRAGLLGSVSAACAAQLTVLG